MLRLVQRLATIAERAIPNAGFFSSSDAFAPVCKIKSPKFTPHTHTHIHSHTRMYTLFLPRTFESRGTNRLGFFYIVLIVFNLVITSEGLILLFTKKITLISIKINIKK